MSDIAPLSPPRTPTPAASLILLRQGEGLEVLVGHRTLSTRAFPGAIVFPGGKQEAQDGAWPDVRADPMRTARYAALRETFEETGLLIEAAGEGPPADAHIGAARQAVEGGELGFADLLRRWDRVLDLERLTAFAHWVTPEGAPYRFDTFFFLAAASAYEAQASLICAEFEQVNWMRPKTLLREHRRLLVTPTLHALDVLSRCSTVSEAVRAAQARTPFDGETERAAQGWAWG